MSPVSSTHDELDMPIPMASNAIVSTSFCLYEMKCNWVSMNSHLTLSHPLKKTNLRTKSHSTLSKTIQIVQISTTIICYIPRFEPLQGMEGDDETIFQIQQSIAKIVRPPFSTKSVTTIIHTYQERISNLICYSDDDKSK